MPNCFTLTPKGEQVPAKLQDVDNKLREAFHQPPDEEHWLWGWYDTIGLALAVGKDWEWIYANFEGENILAAAHWLEGRYEVDCWYEHR